MNNNYEKFSDYQNNYENSKEKNDNEKIVVVEKKKDKEQSLSRGKKGTMSISGIQQVLNIGPIEFIIIYFFALTQKR